MKFTPTKLEGAFIIDIEHIHDERGFFARSWCSKEFEEIGNGSYLKFKNPFPYKPTRDVSSWTASLFFSTGFRGKEFENVINVQVVFETKVDDSFIMNPKVMNIIFIRRIKKQWANV